MLAVRFFTTHFGLGVVVGGRVEAVGWLWGGPRGDPGVGLGWPWDGRGVAAGWLSGGPGVGRGVAMWWPWGGRWVSVGWPWGGSGVARGRARSEGRQHGHLQFGPSLLFVVFFVFTHCLTHE